MTNTHDNWDKLFEQLPLDLTPDEDHCIELRRQALDKFDSQTASPVIASTLNYTGRFLMRYKAPLSTAAAVLIACVIWISLLSSPARAVAEVVAHIMNARTAQWDMTVKSEGSADQQIKMYLTPGHSRQEFESMVTVIDWNKGQSMTLLKDDKLAFRSSVAKLRRGGMKYNQFERMRDALREAMADAERNVEKLGKKQFKKRTLVGYRFKAKSLSTTIWADPVTAFPVRVEVRVSDSSTILMTNYKFNVDLKPSLFSLDVPRGYRLRDDNLPISIGDEQDLIVSLRLCAEGSNGEFPVRLDTKGTAEAASNYLRYVVKRDTVAQVQRSPEEHLQILTRATKGFTFAIGLAANEKWKAHYAGAGVTLGTADRPIFWYKPGDTKRYRVIYADLSVREAVAAPHVADAVKLVP